ncbi:protein DEK [Phycodurus eques]|uniref:protein DEK n=1 Tax=Phycodurus eques TaxID=693459 RepID=UPI002ACEABA9|nr:protein DEK [Phycodurus eques]XP_061551830.1 protein DEK [Phycodurus eques]XP_061551831.1 protein DEK [Phycodurus eques]
MADEASGGRASSEAADEPPETSREVASGAKKSTAGDVIVEGKRAKKSVERLDMQAPRHKEKLTIAQGNGDKLGDIPRTNFHIGKLKPEDLKPLHAILFERPGKTASIKKNLRLFNGFPFHAGSDRYLKKRDKLLKNSHFTNNKLKLLCGILDLEKKGTRAELVERIVTFLLAPKDNGKRLPVKKKKQRSKKKASSDSVAESKKTKSGAKSGRVSSSSSAGPKKSKAIVTDSSSEDEDDRDDEAKAADGEASDAEKSEEEEVTESKKRPRTPAKKTPPPKKRVKRDLSDDDLAGDQKAEKKKKPAAKTDSSSGKTTNTDDTSDEDEPLVGMPKRAPSDGELTETVRALLADADLEETTMKIICQRVFDAFPDRDLSGRKDFIKRTVKSLIT